MVDFLVETGTSIISEEVEEIDKSGGDERVETEMSSMDLFEI